MKMMMKSNKMRLFIFILKIQFVQYDLRIKNLSIILLDFNNKQ